MPQWTGIASRGFSSPAARAARSGSRCPGPTFGPQPQTGSSATSSPGESSRMPSKRSVSPAKYTRTPRPRARTRSPPARRRRGPAARRGPRARRSPRSRPRARGRPAPSRCALRPSFASTATTAGGPYTGAEIPQPPQRRQVEVVAVRVREQDRAGLRQLGHRRRDPAHVPDAVAQQGVGEHARTPSSSISVVAWPTYVMRPSGTASGSHRAGGLSRMLAPAVAGMPAFRCRGGPAPLSAARPDGRLGGDGEPPPVSSDVRARAMELAPRAPGVRACARGDRPRPPVRRRPAGRRARVPAVRGAAAVRAAARRAARLRGHGRARRRPPRPPRRPGSARRC